jgi:glycosyltransferase involved in cell wall biosynthesis
VQGRVRLQSHPRAELADVYGQADVVLFPTQWEEPWGLVPLEAMAVGRPVVASGSGGSSEYLRDGENCLIYSPRSSAGALADAVRRLAGDESLRGELREAGLETAAGFTETTYNEGIEAVLREAAKEPAGSAPPSE